jgi:MFS transporter, DHA2 family, lincomycin resistance protein
VLPVAGAIGIQGLRRLKNVGEPTAGALDFVSVPLAALGFGSLVYGLSLVGRDDAPISPYLLIGGGIVVLGVFVWRQLSLQRGGSPLLDLRTLTHRNYTLSLLLMVIAFMGFLGSMLLMPLYLQDVRGLSPLQTGLLMMPGGLAMGLLGPQVGKVFDRVGGRPLVIPGSIGMTIGLGLFTQIDLHTPYALILGMHILLMVSLAAIFTPVFSLGLGAVPQHLYSHASSLLGALQQVAGAMGAALSVAVLTARGDSLAADGASKLGAYVGGMQWAFGLSAVLSVAVVVLAVILPGRPASHGHGPADGPADVDGELDEIVQDGIGDATVAAG